MRIFALVLLLFIVSACDLKLKPLSPAEYDGVMGGWLIKGLL